MDSLPKRDFMKLVERMTAYVDLHACKLSCFPIFGTVLLVTCRRFFSVL